MVSLYKKNKAIIRVRLNNYNISEGVFVLIGKRLSELRQDLGLTQQELAEKLSISVYTVSSYERNISTPDDEMKKRMSKLFGVSTDYMLGLKDNKLSVNQVKSQMLLLQNLPDAAVKELNDFINYLKNKYNI